MQQGAGRTGRVIGAGAAAAGLLGLGYVGLTWLRYGKHLGNGRRDALLDRFLPSYEVREQHETRVAAPSDVTYAVARELDLHQSGLVRALFKGRELLMGARPGHRQHPQSFLSEVLALGWRVLAEEPGRELVMGAVTQPWKPEVEFRGLEPEEFVGFNQPGYAKIAWTLSVEPTGPATSIFGTETRVATTDAEARRLFRRYWSLVSPGVLLIRYEVLRIVRREATRRATGRALAPPTAGAPIRTG
jgi:hypothetical protein